MNQTGKVPGLSLSIYEKALPQDVQWRERLEMAARAGFGFIEMSLDPSEERLNRLKWSQAKRRELRHMMEDTGVTIQTMCLSAHRFYPFGSSAQSTRDKALAIMREAVGLAFDLGIRIIQIAGYDTYEEDSTETSRAHYIDGLRQAVVWASECSILLGLENQEIGYIDSPTTAVEVIRKVESPYLHLYMDVGNLIVKGCDVANEIAAAQGHLIGLHVKDARLGIPRRVPFGEGEVPFASIFRQLADSGFRGPVMIEMWNEDQPNPVATCAAARRFIEDRLEAAWLHVPRQ